MYNTIFIVLGILALVGVADYIVRKTVLLCQHYQWSGTFAGLTLLSIGTSIPEIFSAVVASFQILNEPGAQTVLSGLVVGQNIGSDIFQQCVILSVVGLAGSIIVKRKQLTKEVGTLILSAVLVLIFALNGVLSRGEGLVLLLVYGGYLIFLRKTRKRNGKQKKLTKQDLRKTILGILVSFIVMGFLADTILRIAKEIVNTYGLNATFLGIILLGIASALPELTTALVSSIRKKKGISTGVIIGSNITNPLFGLGLGSLIAPYTIAPMIVSYDLPFKIVTAVVIYFFLARNERLNRWEAFILLILFITYLGIRALINI